MHLLGDVNASENDEPADVPVSKNLDSCNELSFLSQRQCRLVYRPLRKSDSCLDESFCALMHGSCSDGRVCVFLRCAARDSPLTITLSDKDFMTFPLPKGGHLVIMT